jgi:hypothetical protein
MRYTLEGVEPLAQEFFSSWSGTMTAIDASEQPLLEINAVNWAWRAGVVIFTLAGMRVLLHRRESMRILGGGIICLVIGAFMIANSVCAIGYNHKAYSAEEGDVAEICAINDQLAGRDEFGQVFVVVDDGNTKNNNFIDTYIQDGPGNYRYLTPDELLDYVNAKSDSDRALPADPVRYLLVNAKQDVTPVSEGVEEIGGKGSAGGRFILYHVQEGSEPLKVLISSDKD